MGLWAVSWVVYRHAEAEVLDWLKPETRTENVIGRVYSAPMILWAGLRANVEDIALDLQYAGYARVDEITNPGDMEVGARRIRLKRMSDQSIFEIHFEDEKLHSIRNGKGVILQKRLMLEPVELAELRDDQNRSQRKIQLADLPKHIPEAILAMEDSRFYDHEGIDPIGITRAVVVNVAFGGKSQGASTITQQLVKNLILSNSEKTYQRKAREAVRSIALEQHLDKPELLETYLNEVYLGQAYGAAIVGVDQAARVYFGKPAERLSVGEAAMIGGIISAPNGYTPLRHPEAAKQRRDVTLKRMRDLGWISEAVYDQEIDKPLTTHVTPLSRRAPYFVDAALDAAESELGEGSISRSGLEVHTTLQPALQRIAEWSVEYSVERLVKFYPEAKGANIGMVAINRKDGAVVAMVGGRDYGKSQFNRALYAKRQVGSIVKPLSYAFAFNDNPDWHPGCWIKDEQLSIELDASTWTPKNYDGRYLGVVRARQALASSRNIPSVNLVQKSINHTGESDWLQNRLGKVGLNSTPHLSASLGAFEASPLELASAYTIFPNAGIYFPPRMITQVDNTNGETVFQPPTQAKTQVIDSLSSGMTLDMLREVVKTGTGKSAASFGAKGSLAGKTGTTNQSRDAWFVGFDDTYVVAVWVGFDEGKPLGLTGGQAALPTWSRFMAGLGPRPEEFIVASGLIRNSVCLEMETCSNYYSELMRRDSSAECTLYDDEREGILSTIIPRLWFGNENTPDEDSNENIETVRPRNRLFRKRNRE
ncbi:MAG: transglycosylase domain-containing protein [Myxococcota bacterium]